MDMERFTFVVAGQEDAFGERLLARRARVEVEKARLEASQLRRQGAELELGQGHSSLAAPTAAICRGFSCTR